MDKAQQSLEQLEAALENGANMTEEEKAELQNQIAELNVQIQTIQAGIGQIENGLKAQGITDIDTTISTLQKEFLQQKQNWQMAKNKSKVLKTVRKFRKRTRKPEKFNILSIEPS